MTQRAEVFATEPKDLSSIPRTHVMEGENPRSQVLLWLPIQHAWTHIKETEISINMWTFLKIIMSQALVRWLSRWRSFLSSLTTRVLSPIWRKERPNSHKLSSDPWKRITPCTTPTYKMKKNGTTLNIINSVLEDVLPGVRIHVGVTLPKFNKGTRTGPSVLIRLSGPAKHFQPFALEIKLYEQTWNW